jgi:hypothetical protein
MAGGVVPSEKPVSKKLGPCNFALLFVACEQICCLALSDIAMASAPSANSRPIFALARNIVIGAPSFDRIAIYDGEHSTGGTADRQFPNGLTRNCGQARSVETSDAETLSGQQPGRARMDDFGAIAHWYDVY